MITYIDEAYRICQDYNENECFWQKMKDTETMEENCFCLSDCSVSKYDHFDSFMPLSDKCEIGWYNEEYDVYLDETGNNLGREVDWHKRLSR